MPKRKAAPSPLAEDRRCAWYSGSERCSYPGALSSGTHGEGPWYCRHHFDIRDPAMGAAIVEQSQSYRPPRDLDEARARSLAAAQASADDFATTHGLKTAEDCIRFCRDTLAMPRDTARAAIIERWRAILHNPRAHQITRALAADALNKLAAFSEREPGADDE